MSIERDPKPSRTKRGVGARAKVDLSIYYYCAADGVGADFGAFYVETTMDDGSCTSRTKLSLRASSAGSWLGCRAEATAARDDALEKGRADGPAVFLKTIGAVGWPADEIWWQDARGASDPAT